MPVESSDLVIPADDAHPLAATLFRDAALSAGPVTIIASATGVPRRYYGRFARFLAANGRPVLTFDYRGIGGSLTGLIDASPARFRDWGILDIPGVLAWASANFPDRPIHWIGHSYGGFGTGLAHNNHLVARHLGVSTMTADYRLLANRYEQAKVYVMFGAVVPIAARAFGYVPGRLNGNSTDLPRGVASEWGDWVMTPGFLFGVDDLPERRYFAQQTAPMHFLFASDDPWIVREGVSHLAGQFTRAHDRSIVEITPQDARVPSIGHVGFFRSELAETVWPRALAWLDA